MLSGSRSYSSIPIASAAWRLDLFALLWLILCRGDFTSWPFAVPTVILATWLSLRLSGHRPLGIRPLVLLHFLPFFIVKSIASAFDVMVRVLHPRLPITPGLIEYPLTISDDGGRVFLANSITLLPGTISARLTSDHLVIHTLDTNLPVLAMIKDLENRIMAFYRPSPQDDKLGRQP